MKPIVVVDFDGTLYDSSARQHLAQNQEWEEFHKASFQDPPNEAVLDLLKALPPTTMVVGCTGRNEGHRILTDAWLQKYCVPMDAVLMRPEHDYSSDTIIKPQLLQEWCHEHFPGEDLVDLVWFVLEDRDKMVEAWRDMGFPCWQVNEGVY